MADMYDLVHKACSDAGRWLRADVHSKQRRGMVDPLPITYAGGSYDLRAPASQQPQLHLRPNTRSCPSLHPPAITTRPFF